MELEEDAVHIPKYGFQFVDFSVLRSRADDVTSLSGIFFYPLCVHIGCEIT